MLLQAAAALQAYCQQELSSIHTTVHVAQQLQTLDVSLPTPTDHAMLSRDVLSHVGLRTMGEYQLGWLKGVAHPADQQASNAVQSRSGKSLLLSFSAHLLLLTDHCGLLRAVSSRPKQAHQMMLVVCSFLLHLLLRTQTWSALALPVVTKATCASQAVPYSTRYFVILPLLTHCMPQIVDTAACFVCGGQRPQSQNHLEQQPSHLTSPHNNLQSKARELTSSLLHARSSGF